MGTPASISASVAALIAAARFPVVGICCQAPFVHENCAETSHPSTTAEAFALTAIALQDLHENINARPRVQVREHGCLQRFCNP
jgi:hypothetical protein